LNMYPSIVFLKHSRHCLRKWFFALLFTSTLWIATSACGGGNSATNPTSHDQVSISISPSATNVALGGTKQFSAVVHGSTNGAVTWTLTGSGCSGVECGTLSGTTENPVTYTSPASIPSNFVILTATPTADQSQSASVQITIVDATGISVSVTPTSVTLGPGGSQTFTAVVNDPSNSGLEWHLAGFVCRLGPCGRVSLQTKTGTGETIVYTAPNFSGTLPDGLNVVTVTVSSAIDSSKNDSATVALVN
jgi:hypothetical protein